MIIMNKNYQSSEIFIFLSIILKNVFEKVENWTEIPNNFCLFCKESGD